MSQRIVYVCDRCGSETAKAELYSVTVKPPHGRGKPPKPTELDLCSTCSTELTRPALVELAKA